MQRQLVGEAQQEHQIPSRAEVSVAVIPHEVPLHYKGVGFALVKYDLFHNQGKGMLRQCLTCVRRLASDCLRDMPACPGHLLPECNSLHLHANIGCRCQACFVAADACLVNQNVKY